MLDLESFHAVMQVGAGLRKSRRTVRCGESDEQLHLYNVGGGGGEWGDTYHDVTVGKLCRGIGSDPG
jgi:hypothetical protein